ncbi:MAG: ice-binding family protein [Nitrososphaerales archaeon]
MSKRTVLLAALAIVLVLPLASFSLLFSSGYSVPLGTVSSFAVLAGSAITNTGSSTVVGNVGLSPGSSNGLLPASVAGTIYVDDPVAVQAQVDNTAAYDSLENQTCTDSLTGTDLGGLTLTPGVYCFSSAAQLTGILTLNAQNNSNALFIFKIGSTLTTSSGSSVLVINGGSECKVFWQVVTSVTLDTNTAFAGNIFALDSITLDTSASVSGRVLAQTGAVAMDTNKVDSSMCQSGTTSTTTVTSTVTAPATTVTSTITSPTTTTVTFNQTSTTTETSTITSPTTTTITSTSPPITSTTTQTVTSTETSTVPTTTTVTSTVTSPTTATVTAAQTTTTVTLTQTSTTTATSTIPTTTTVTSTQISPTTQTVTTTVTSTVASPTTTTATATQTVASTVTSTIISPITVTVTETQQYTSTQTVTASSTNPCSQTFGTSMLTVKSIATNGTTIYGYEVEAFCQGSHLVSGFTPVTLTLNNNEQYTVTIDQNYGSCSFAYWQNTGSALPTTSVTISSNTSLTAVYNCRNIPSGPSVFVQTLDQNGNVITGYYVRLFDNGQEMNDAYSPATFQLIDGQTYSIETSSYLSCTFSHWQDTGSTNSTRTTTASNNMQTFTAVYACTTPGIGSVLLGPVRSTSVSPQLLISARDNSVKSSGNTALTIHWKIAQIEAPARAILW